MVTEGRVDLGRVGKENMDITEIHMKLKYTHISYAFFIYKPVIL